MQHPAEKVADEAFDQLQRISRRHARDCRDRSYRKSPPRIVSYVVFLPAPTISANRLVQRWQELRRNFENPEKYSEDSLFLSSFTFLVSISLFLSLSISSSSVSL